MDLKEAMRWADLAGILRKYKVNPSLAASMIFESVETFDCELDYESRDYLMYELTSIIDEDDGGDTN